MDPTQAIFAETLINSVISQGLLGRLTDGTNLSNEPERRNTELTSLGPTGQRNSPVAAKNNREMYTQYFNSEGRVQWQDDMLQKGKA